MRSRRREFADGFRNLTPLVLVAAALAAVGGLVGLQLFVARSAFTVIPEQRLLRIANDDYAHVSYRVAELKKHPPSLPVVYLFGGSGTIELVTSERSLSSAVTAAAGSPVEVVDLANHDQSLGQTLAIVDNLPRTAGLLAIGVSPNRLTTSPQDDASQLYGMPLALSSPHLAAVLSGRVTVTRRLPGLLPGIFDYLLSYYRVRTSLETPWLTAIPRAEHYSSWQLPDMTTRVSGSRQELARQNARQKELYDARVKALTTQLQADPTNGARMLALAEAYQIRAGTKQTGSSGAQSDYARALALYDKFLSRASQYAAYNLDVLRAIIRLGRERGFVVALFEQPLNPEASGPNWRGLLATYRADVRELARQEGVPYIEAQPRARPTAGDFADLFHLLASGRDKWTVVFAPRLARALAAGRGGVMGMTPQSSP
jgi:hypothetical protein